MTINHPIRRFLARVCSDNTMARVVDPTLADMRWESGRPLWPGYIALAKALMVHSIVSTPAVLSRTWSDDDHAIPKVAGFAVAGALLLAMAQVAPWLFARNIANREASVVGMALLLTPMALTVTLPAALLLAIPLALRRLEPSRRLARRTVAFSLACLGATFVLGAWVTPETNQAFRVLVSGQQLARGWAEQGLAVQRERIEVLNLTPGGRVKARLLEFDYQVRLVLICAPLPLGILALAISRSRRGRRRPWAMGLAALSAYLLGFFPLLLGARVLMRWSSLPPVIFAWAPMALLAALSVLLIHRSRRFPSPPLLPPPASLDA
jgi:Lipopolysaccharide export system permease LptF/LptG